MASRHKEIPWPLVTHEITASPRGPSWEARAGLPPSGRAWGRPACWPLSA